MLYFVCKKSHEFLNALFDISLDFQYCITLFSETVYKFEIKKYFANMTKKIKDITFASF